MSPAQRYKFSLPVFLAILVTLISTGLQLGAGKWPSGLPMIEIDLWLRFLRTLLMAFFVWSGSFVVTLKSPQINLRLAFLLAVIADYFLIIQHRLIPAICIFAIMQVVLVLRHMPGKVEFLSRKKEALYSLSCFLWCWLLLVEYLFHSIKGNILYVPVLIYAALLLFSTTVAWWSKYNFSFSSRQGGYIFLAMVLFLICDVTVFLPYIFPDNVAVLLLRAFTGMFYTPSLILLALSGLPDALPTQSTSKDVSKFRDH
ncbi:MAG: hypothetical protein IPN29_06410 [Saprospiraceae bacterium]|nr:hypothetical protein [Saprospiraceae bacterium]